MGAFDQVAHGAIDHAECAALGIAPEQVTDFSSNLNPFGPPSSVRAALSALDPAAGAPPRMRTGSDTCGERRE